MLRQPFFSVGALFIFAANINEICKKRIKETDICKYIYFYDCKACEATEEEFFNTKKYINHVCLILTSNISDLTHSDQDNFHYSFQFCPKCYFTRAYKYKRNKKITCFYKCKYVLQTKLLILSVQINMLMKKMWIYMLHCPQIIQSYFNLDNLYMVLAALTSNRYHISVI